MILIEKNTLNSPLYSQARLYFQEQRTGNYQGLLVKPVLEIRPSKSLRI